MGISFGASKAREKALTVVRAANACIQLRSNRSRVDRPDDADWGLSLPGWPLKRALASLSEISIPACCQANYPP